MIYLAFIQGVIGWDLMSGDSLLRSLPLCLCVAIGELAWEVDVMNSSPGHKVFLLNQINSSVVLSTATQNVYASKTQGAAHKVE